MGEPCQVHEMTLKHFEQFQENQKEIATSLSSLRERLVIAEQSTKSAHHRMDTQEKQLDALVKIANGVEMLAKETEGVIKTLATHHERITDLEKAPGENLLANWKAFVTGIIVAGAGLICAKMFGLIF